MDPIQRFSSKAQVYAHYRPDFTPQAIAALKKVTGLPYEARVMDIGAGTGMLTRLLLTHFASVFALEPNSEMRAVATINLRKFPGFHLLAARAEAIPLAENSIDLITAGRVLHWLQPEPTRAEFRRMAKQGAWLAIARLRMVDELFLQALRALRTPENGFGSRTEGHRPGDVPVEFYFTDGQYQTLTFRHTHDQSLEGFVGGLQSGSYAPNEDHPLYENFLQAAHRVFERFSFGESMTVQLATELHYGRL